MTNREKFKELFGFIPNDDECMCPKGFPCFSIFCEDCPFNDTWWERDYHECFKPNWEE